MNRFIKQNKETQFLSLQCPEQEIAGLITAAKEHFDDFFHCLKIQLINFLISSEREMLAGPKHHPYQGWKKWGSQSGSVYIGGERVRIKKPRLRKDDKEIKLSVYEEMKQRNMFSTELLAKSLRGISCRDYKDTLEGLLHHFGVSKSAVSRHLKAATTKKLKELQERSLENIDPFAIFIDGYHVGGKIFIVALAISTKGQKRVLGFWEGATENHDVCLELLRSLERRGLILSEQILFVTDGGSGIIKAIKDRFGKLLQHQRCTIHKDRNIQKHLPKKYRKEAHRRFRNAIDCAQYEDAKAELDKLGKWLELINPSAAASLQECIEELLTVHRLQVPPLLRRTLHSTNPIESMFSQVSQRIGKITNIKGEPLMAQRWVGTALLFAEEKFRSIKGSLSIGDIQRRILNMQDEIKRAIA